MCGFSHKQISMYIYIYIYVICRDISCFMMFLFRSFVVNSAILDLWFIREVVVEGVGKSRSPFQGIWGRNGSEGREYHRKGQDRRGEYARLPSFSVFFSTKFRVLESEPYFQVGAVGELVKGDSLPGTWQGLVYERYRYLDAHPKSSKWSINMLHPNILSDQYTSLKRTIRASPRSQGIQKEIIIFKPSI